MGSDCHQIGGEPLAEVASAIRKERVGGGGWRESRRRRKLGLITSCIFKQAHAPCGKESSILGEAHEKEGDMRRQRQRQSWLVKWRLGAAGLMQYG